MWITARSSRRRQGNILRLVDSGVAQGAKLVVDGRDFKLQGYEDGFFVGPHAVRPRDPDMDIYKQEIFGPVLSTVRAQDLRRGAGYAMDHEYGNGTAIFTRDGDTARDFANRINIGMVGINVPIPVPLAYHTFGGWKKSGFGDLNQHGPDAFRFYTRTKTVTARWFRAASRKDRPLPRLVWRRLRPALAAPPEQAVPGNVPAREGDGGPSPMGAPDNERAARRPPLACRCV
jgi:acyl-CoA reductase-like NAD-dependent aldehyde dehydrogenase